MPQFSSFWSYADSRNEAPLTAASHLGCNQRSCHSTNRSAGVEVPRPEALVGAAWLPAGRQTLPQAITLQIQPWGHLAELSHSI